MRLNRIAKVLFSGLATMLIASSADAHGVFKKEIEKKFPGMKIECNTCHIDKKPKTDRNVFGGLFFKELESEELTKNWKDKKGPDKKEYEEKVMAPAFEKAMTKVMAMTFEDIIKAGLYEGIKAEEKTSTLFDAFAHKSSNKSVPIIMMLVSTSMTNPEPKAHHQIGALFRRTCLKRFRI